MKLLNNIAYEVKPLYLDYQISLAASPINVNTGFILRNDLGFALDNITVFLKVMDFLNNEHLASLESEFEFYLRSDRYPITQEDYPINSGGGVGWSKSDPVSNRRLLKPELANKGFDSFGTRYDFNVRGQLPADTIGGTAPVAFLRFSADIILQNAKIT